MTELDKNEHNVQNNGPKVVSSMILVAAIVAISLAIALKEFLG